MFLIWDFSPFICLHFPQSFFTAYCLYLFYFFNIYLFFIIKNTKDIIVTKFVMGFYKGIFPTRDSDCDFPELPDDRAKAELNKIMEKQLLTRWNKTERLTSMIKASWLLWWITSLYGSCSSYSSRMNYSKWFPQPVEKWVLQLFRHQ